MLAPTIIQPAGPVISYAKHDYLNSFGLFGNYASEVANLSGLFLISISWTLESGGVDDFAGLYHEIAARFLRARIIVLANTDEEKRLLKARGVPALRCSSTLLVDDRIFRVPDRPAPSPPAYRTLINARFSSFKRHELAVSVPDLGLIYTRHGLVDGEFEEGEERVRNLLPTAAFLNRELNDGAYRDLTLHEVATCTAMAQSALVLSAVEGNCRASMEALMCGVPVVSTPSLGGRDRFYRSPYAIVAAPDAISITAANAEILSRRLDPRDVRAQVMAQVEVERQLFLEELQEEVRHLFPGAGPLCDFRPFVDVNPWVPARKTSGGAALAEFLGSTL